MIARFLERLGLALTLALASHGPVSADPTQALDDKATGIFGETANQGAAHVDTATGAFTYSYPFRLPQARGKVEPALSLTYSSASRVDGEAGMGWTLNLPKIQRTSVSGYPTFRDDLDHFEFNGKTLVFICTVTNHFTCTNSADEWYQEELFPNWAKGARYYRLQIEGYFARFFLLEGGRTWVVQEKGGTQQVFGQTDSVRSLDEDEKHLDGLDLHNYNQPFRWNLVLQEDLRGNQVAYVWKLLRTSERRKYLTDIYYNYALRGLDTTFASYEHHIQLDWERNYFSVYRYGDEWRDRPEWRLARVGVASAKWGDSADGRISGIKREVGLTYELRYLAPRALAQDPQPKAAPLWGFSYLGSIQLHGRCGATEESGYIPKQLVCSNTQDVKPLPPIEFEYSGAFVGAIGLPADMLGKNYQRIPTRIAPFQDYFYDVKTVSIVDINRDGLPDLVQSWWHQRLIDLAAEASVPFPFEVEASLPLHEQFAYINTTDLFAAVGLLKFEHACLDPSLVAPRIGRNTTTFLNSQKGSAVIGPWGRSNFLWSEIDFAPVWVTPISNLSPRFCPEVSPSPSGTPGDPNHPAWQWRFQENTGGESSWIDRTYSFAGNTSDPWNSSWFVDVDGNGFADALRSDGSGQVLGLVPAKVQFTQKRRWPRSPHWRIYPFLWDPRHPPTGISMVPGPSRQVGIHATAANYFYTDLDGDGAVDLVVHDGGKEARVRPGDGKGQFAASPSRETYAAAMYPHDPKAMRLAFPPEPDLWPDGYPWNALNRHNTFFHDVTGDGRADIIQVKVDEAAEGFVRLWVNVDGRTFRCIEPKKQCVIGMFMDGARGTFKFDASRTTFADMDGNGFDDIVVISPYGIFSAPVMHSTTSQALAPGLMVAIHNGVGATQRIEYETIQHLAHEATVVNFHQCDRKNPSTWTFDHTWCFVSPQPAHLVTKISVEPSAPAATDPPIADPFRFERTTRYEYRDPAYDLWSRRLVGFRKVRVHDGAATTEVSYIFSKCQLDTITDCPETSEDHDDKSLVGLPSEILVMKDFVRDLGIGLLSKTVYSYNTKYLLQQHTNTNEERRVHFSHVYRTSVQEFDPAKDFRTQTTPVHVTEVTLDDFGNPTRIDRFSETSGSREDALSRSGVRISEIWTNRNLPLCSEKWTCLADRYRVESRTDGSLQPTVERSMRYNFSRWGDVTDVLQLLSGTQPLMRRHARASAQVAPTPSAAASDGWRHIAHIEYDDISGNILVTSIPGVDDVCTTFVYDWTYSLYPIRVQSHKKGCASTSLDVTYQYDRAWGLVTRTTGPNGATQEVQYDHIGRIQEVRGTAGDSGSIVTQAQLEYGDTGPKRWIKVQQIGDSPVAAEVVFLNALDELVLGFQQADQPSSDPGPWIRTHWVVRDSRGLVTLSARPEYFTDGDPLNIVPRMGAVSRGRAGVDEFSYDAFGRLTQVNNNGAELRYKYFPQRIEMRDGAHLAREAANGRPAYLATVYDERGNLVRTEDALGDDTVIAQYQYSPMDDVLAVTRTHSANPDDVLHRHFEYDSFGRMVGNSETMSNSQTSAPTWVYAYDDANRLVATSDPRGCGKNIYYDGLGRQVAADFSPCKNHHPPYTQPDLTTGVGTELFLKFDQYEHGQVSAEPGFPDTSANAMGQTTAVYDRGAHTRVNYDARGLIRKIARRIVRPTGSEADIGRRYARNWYSKRIDFDSFDRPVTETTGLTDARLLSGGRSQVTYQYTLRGLLRSMSSSYGEIVRNTKHDATGKPLAIEYGDAARSLEEFSYDSRERLSIHRLARGATHVWELSSAVNGLSYTSPPLENRPLTVFDRRFEYDTVGNPTSISDVADPTPFPSYTKPVAKRMAYDSAHRIGRVEYAYAQGDVHRSPYRPEAVAGQAYPPEATADRRVRWQSFQFDWKGAMRSNDDADVLVDRSLGATTFFNDQLRGADGGRVSGQYDEMGNLTALDVLSTKKCGGGSALASRCLHRLRLEWDEVGQLTVARRWDDDVPNRVAINANATSASAFIGARSSRTPDWVVRYAYSEGLRVFRSVARGPRKATGPARFFANISLEVFDSLRFDGATYDSVSGDYSAVKPEAQSAYLGGLARVVYDKRLPSPRGDPKHLLLLFSDELGSTTAVVDAASSELVEKTTYFPHGSLESDFRSERWRNFREPYKFSGKEEDLVTGLLYFGARYLHPKLGVWTSADPLDVHSGASVQSPYSYVGGRVFAAIDELGLQSAVVQMPPAVITGHRPKDPPPPKPVSRDETVKPEKAKEKQPSDFVKRAEQAAFRLASDYAGYQKSAWQGATNALAADVEMMINLSTIQARALFGGPSLTLPRFAPQNKYGEISGEVSYFLLGTVLIPEAKALQGTQLLRGVKFEAAILSKLGLPKNTLLNFRHIADVFLPKAFYEIKDVMFVYLSKQLREMTLHASLRKSAFNLIVSERNLHITKPVVEAVERTGGRILMFNPETNVMRVYRDGAWEVLKDAIH